MHTLSNPNGCIGCPARSVGQNPVRHHCRIEGRNLPIVPDHVMVGWAPTWCPAREGYLITTSAKAVATQQEVVDARQRLEYLQSLRDTSIGWEIDRDIDLAHQRITFLEGKDPRNDDP